MSRKIAASFLLMVMSFLIGLQAPVLGYCPNTDTFFITAPACAEHEDHHHDHSTDCHEHEKEEAPCEDSHEFLTLDSSEFFWNSEAPTSAPVFEPLPSSEQPAAPVAQPRSYLSFEPPSLRAPPPPCRLFLLHSVVRR